MNTLNTASSKAGFRTNCEQPASDVVEVALLLSRQQISQLAQQAQRRGLTSAQFLRQYISSLCQGVPESV